MRALFLFLLVVNLLFFGYTRLAEQRTAEQERNRQQIKPDAIKLLTAAQYRALKPGADGRDPKESARSLAKADPVNACFEWGPFTDAERVRAEKYLNDASIPAPISQRQIETPTAWWVFIPPLPSKPDADRKVRELRALGITDLYVIQDAGPAQLAISLGVFKSEDAAQRHLQQLKNKGARSAIVQPRTQTINQVQLLMKGLSPAQADKLVAAKADFVGSDLKPSSCP